MDGCPRRWRRTAHPNHRLATPQPPLHPSPPQARPVWHSPQHDMAFLRVDPAALPPGTPSARLASWTSFAADHPAAAADFAPILSVGAPDAFPFA